MKSNRRILAPAILSSLALCSTGCNPFANLPSPDSKPLPDCGEARTISADGYATVELICFQSDSLNPLDELSPIAIADDGTVLVNDMVLEPFSLGGSVNLGDRGLVFQAGSWSSIGEGTMIGMSNNGIIAGSTVNSVTLGIDYRPYLWRDGVRIALPALSPGVTGEAFSANSSGAVVGWADPTPPPGAFLKHLPPVSPKNGVQQAFQSVPVLWKHDGDGWSLMNLAAGGSGVDYTYSSSPGALPKINDRGQILLALNSVAAIWTDGVLTDIGTLGGLENQYTYAYDLNNLGQVVGKSDSAEFDTFAGVDGSEIPYPRSHAFLFTDGVLQDLGTLGGPISEAFAINDSGVIIGRADTAEFSTYSSDSYKFYDSQIFVYRNGSMVTLESLLPPELQGAGVYAYDINNRDQILAMVYLPSEGDVYPAYIAIITLPPQ